uniref:Uncharacterized protein n=1 Tax=Chromera velia CCMP2878 TaxID=1169474 RepID=A0A0G4HDN6_9ALVE|mmetsp:Transcript_3439/g.7122  ORF Transcript_3439/g.7122 Transcript_3439/m.7122 type:complete len:194 (+) Transcript_3439:149-730(+)|eukprot:Cvel_6413.t1-p1 / transcript=Cvel_6413.t1 / gene=Cvel_6413 / organism=Chromera_velia_CCMP2878 / gene_product=hypothetical protein / transcript_product=hypothetical protein / location=Cvel_scaffold313:78215-78793(-) / protein_length=193 / sequence_SO=supercontig / SO=protein_coding / is_pseudo=false
MLIRSLISLAASAACVSGARQILVERPNVEAGSVEEIGLQWSGTSRLVFDVTFYAEYVINLDMVFADLIRFDSGLAITTNFNSFYRLNMFALGAEWKRESANLRFSMLDEGGFKKRELRFQLTIDPSKGSFQSTCEGTERSDTTTPFTLEELGNKVTVGDESGQVKRLKVLIYTEDDHGEASEADGQMAEVFA